jgi:DNA-(apurinic or apyrimidinic site) lyase
MTKIYNLLKNYTLEDALNLEKQDLQYKSLEKLYNNIQDKHLFFWLILANSIVCYQLSSSGEEYWEEFSWKTSEYFLEKKEKIQAIFHTSPSLKLNTTGSSEWQLSINIIRFLKDFLPNSKWNKRLLEIKIKRLEKLKWFLDIFLYKLDYYLENILTLRHDLANGMKQKKDAKTIVFAIKMFMYGMRIVGNKNEWKLIYKINIPIDSRLINIFEIYKEDYTDIKKFYSDLSIKLKIPEIHLDAILWCNYKNLIEK